MAQIDAGIYNALGQGQKSALDYAEQYAQADDRKAQRAFNALAMQEKQAALADQQGYRQAIAAAPTDQDARVKALLGSSNPLAIKHGQEMQKAALDAANVQSQARSHNATAAKTEWDAQKARQDYAWQAIGAASDPDSAQRLIDDGVSKGHFSMQDAQRLNGELQQVRGNPQAFQQWRTQKVIGLLSAHDQLNATSPKPTEIKLGDRVLMIDMNPNSPTYKQEVSSQKVGVSPDSVLSAETQRRGQNMTDARARAALEQGERHFQATQGAGGKMTEDQGKATGWLIQAENAWKNMQAAVDPKTGGGIDAAKPGLNDALAAIPSLGLTTSLANSMRGEKRQQFMQGASSLSEAMLRAATGAGVNKDEAAQKVKELTPVWGDDEKTIKQKMDSIPLYIESLKVRAGPGAGKAAVVLGTGSVPNNAMSVPKLKPGGTVRFDSQGNMIP